MQSVIMLNVIMLCVVMLSAVAPWVTLPQVQKLLIIAAITIT
jgi:hypothetical protein